MPCGGSIRERAPRDDGPVVEVTAMTMALCLNCGETKFGAFCPCPSCRAESTGNQELDILFSDHHFTVATLQQFGAVVKEIHGHCDDPRTCFWAFIHYIAQYHAGILGMDLKPEVKRELEALLAQCTLPPVVIEKSAAQRQMEALDKAGGESSC